MKVILYMAMTVNGMIARENDDAPWSDEVWKGYQKVVKDSGNIIVGERTYQIMTQEKGEFESIGDPFTVIVSGSQDVKTKASNHVVVPTPEDALTMLKEKDFATALVGGGATLNTSFIKEKLIDEILVDVEPLLFGNGIPFLIPEELEAKLELVKVAQVGESNTAQLHYKVRR